MDGVGPIARNAGLNMIPSPHNILLCENKTRQENIVLDRRFIRVNFNVIINVEDIAMMLNIYDLFISQTPQNFIFYDYEYYNYIDVTEMTREWDFENDDLENVFIMADPTYRYEDRMFASVLNSPFFKINSITHQTDKDMQMHSVQLSIEGYLEVPNVLVFDSYTFIESIEVVIDTVFKYPQTYPVLIDIPENFLVNKNIRRGIILSPDNFIFDTDDSNTEQNPESYLMVKADINTNVFTPSLWAVEDVTETSSKRYFIPLKHAKIIKIRDEATDEVIETRFYSNEINLFKDFQLGNPYNLLKLILFSE
jgi:hypothetical protein